ncbi:PH (Pleckstrin Homology) domain-containing protein [Nitrospirillum pindoramense]|uniref:PH (Pleckstrin Homology) domain-containing protein n=2 Tax=Nitrospirillum amazonense TaxID=28077 RepID=A0A560HG80_9PROT|nr:PH (Pleckstrin Homology) domain-containing protein [Nitrospirillum amazonense]
MAGTILSYVASNLMPGEAVFAVGRIHWIIYAKPSFFLAGAAIMAFLATDPGTRPILTILGAIAAFGGVTDLARAWFHAKTTELAVTTKRVIVKQGIIRRTTVELNLSKVESFHVEQSIPGRLLNYGTVIIRGVAGTPTPIAGIAEPLAFRKQAILAIETVDSPSR